MRRVLGLAVVLALLLPGAALAQECIGTVVGLSRVYDPSTGSGFLAVRAGPTRSATQLGELFNGDRVSIFDRQGNWYRVYVPGIGEAWASSRWIRNSCGY
jgi:uncharacterized protein YgiM (DUF1202 family)